MEKIAYPVYSVRVEADMKEWLRQEAEKYKSPNLFFRNLRKAYDIANEEKGRKNN